MCVRQLGTNLIYKIKIIIGQAVARILICDLQYWFCEKKYKYAIILRVSPFFSGISLCLYKKMTSK